VNLVDVPTLFYLAPTARRGYLDIRFTGVALSSALHGEPVDEFAQQKYKDYSVRLPRTSSGTISVNRFGASLIITY